MKVNMMKLDAQGSAFFNRELEVVKSKTYDVKHKELRALTLLPVETDTHNGAETITWRSYDKVGTAKIIADYATDFPNVDVLGEEKSVKPKSIGNSYRYSIEEIRRSQMVGKSLDSRRAAAARRGHDEKHDDIAWNGSTKAGLNGFINYPGITEYTVPNGTGGNSTWASKTPDEIFADVTGIMNAVQVPTNNKEMPDTLFLPLAQYNDIAFRRVTDGDSTTVLAYILKNHPTLKAIEWVNELKGAGTGGADRMMVLVRDVDHVAIQIPQPFEQFDADKKGMAYMIPCHSKTAGVIVYYPQSVAFGDGI